MLREMESRELRRKFFQDPVRLEALRMHEYTLKAGSTLRLIHSVFATVTECSMVSTKLAELLAKRMGSYGSKLSRGRRLSLFVQVT